MCKKCNKFKDFKDFSKDRGSHSKDGLNYRCKSCVSIYQKEWVQKNPQKAKSINIKCLYGINLEMYNSLAQAQNHRCRLCDEEKKLFIDHDHNTKEVRGLLCNSCNLAIAIFDNKPLYEKAALYVGGK